MMSRVPIWMYESCHSYGGSDEWVSGNFYSSRDANSPPESCLSLCDGTASGRWWVVADGHEIPRRQRDLQQTPRLVDPDFVHFAATKDRAQVSRRQIVIPDLQGLLTDRGHRHGALDVRATGNHYRHAAAAPTEHQEPVLVDNLVIQDQGAGRDDVLARGRPTTAGDGGVQTTPRQGAPPTLGGSATPRGHLVARYSAVRAGAKLGSHFPVTVRNVSARNVFSDVATRRGADSEVLATGRTPTNGDGKTPFV